MNAYGSFRHASKAPHDDGNGAANRARRRDDHGDASDPDKPIPPDPGKVTDFELEEEGDTDETAALTKTRRKKGLPHGSPEIRCHSG